MPYKDPEKRRAAQRAWAAKNRQANLDTIKTRSRYRKRKAVMFVQRYKEMLGCVDCEIKYPGFVLEFDHVKGDKVAAVSTMISGGYAMTSIKEEIRKCEVVCANCHRVRTWSRREVKYGR